MPKKIVHSIHTKKEKNKQDQRSYGAYLGLIRLFNGCVQGRAGFQWLPQWALNPHKMKALHI
ncbi:MAG: hypothetical protein KAT62_06260 [Desulfuromonadales bacterium]|nr:hypothetical protein [Desulfuromonadales bacterium]